MKKPIVIIIIIIALFALSLGAYFAWKNAQVPAVIPGDGEPGSPQFPVGDPRDDPFPGPTTDPQDFPLVLPPQSLPQKLNIISNQPVFDYWIMDTTTSTEIFYLGLNGKIFRVTAGQDELITSEGIENIQVIQSRGEGRMVVIKYGSKTEATFTIFDSEQKMFIPFEDAVIAAAVSPDNLKVAYLNKAGDLMIKELTGDVPEITNIISLNQNNISFNWIAPRKILISSPPSGQAENQIWVLDLEDNTLGLAASGKGLMTQWSPDGALGLLSEAIGERTLQLRLIDNSGAVMANIISFVTLPEKCLISDPQIYCAIPKRYNSITSPIMPDDYLKRAVYSIDKFSLINFSAEEQTSNTTLIFNEEEPAIDAIHLSFFENKLIFINRYDDRIYSLELQ